MSWIFNDHYVRSGVYLSLRAPPSMLAEGPPRRTGEGFSSRARYGVQSACSVLLHEIPKTPTEDCFLQAPVVRLHVAGIFVFCLLVERISQIRAVLNRVLLATRDRHPVAGLDQVFQFIHGFWFCSTAEPSGHKTAGNIRGQDLWARNFVGHYSDRREIVSVKG